ncbi:hypothetical protein BHE74_00030610 [Ensete ventricosum]|nr:hypothetical protein GW17_00056837 [Ensete ventricosum]RWW62267.1 hypothetical protein BHE74_00030610 [Ensete ventricosum]RZS18570.1 hypothetical protein BHM03_00050862 [Ensete ventricosum]
MAVQLCCVCNMVVLRSEERLHKHMWRQMSSRLQETYNRVASATFSQISDVHKLLNRKRQRECATVHSFCSQLSSGMEPHNNITATEHRDACCMGSMATRGPVHCIITTIATFQAPRPVSRVATATSHHYCAERRRHRTTLPIAAARR